MKTILTVVITLFLCAKAGAVQPGPAFEDLRAAAGPAAETPVRAALSTSTPDSVELAMGDNWELFQFGGKTFEFEGSSYAIKLVFVRGQYDPFAKTFKTEAQYVLSDVTRVSENVTYWRVRPINGDVQVFGLGNNREFDIYFGSDRVFSIRCYDKNAGKFTDVAKVSYQELRSLWQEAAWLWLMEMSGNTYFFVPQMTWDGTVTRSGFVISEDMPFYYTTSMPIDYVELSREQDGLPTYAPTGYSLPTGLAFDYTRDNTWTARKMLPDEWSEQAQVMADSDRAVRGPIKEFAVRREPAKRK